MKSHLILENIARHVQLSKDEEKHFFNLLHKRTLKKKQFLFHENTVVKEIAFVVKGCLRSYSIDNNGFEHIIQFAPTDWWISDMYSLITQKEGSLNIDAIENTEVMLLSRIDQLKLFDDIPKFERFFRIITENSLAGTRQRLLDNLSLTAMQRYESFCKLYPGLKNKISQKHIASYIGVTPEFLSKMKAESLKKLI